MAEREAGLGLENTAQVVDTLQESLPGLWERLHAQLFYTPRCMDTWILPGLLPSNSKWSVGELS